MEEQIFRIASLKDLGSIVEIYNQAVLAKNATAETNICTVEDKLNWFNIHSAERFPVYVVENKEKIIGWGSISPYRKERQGLKTTAEISYYLDYRFHGKGIGKKIMNYMIDDCKRLKIRVLLAVLLEINKPSIQILKYFGFQKWGFLPEVVCQHGYVCGQFIYGKNLS